MLGMLAARVFGFGGDIEKTLGCMKYQQKSWPLSLKTVKRWVGGG
jgi:hypothetical protein